MTTERLTAEELDELKGLARNRYPTVTLGKKEFRQLLDDAEENERLRGENEWLRAAMTASVNAGPNPGPVYWKWQQDHFRELLENTGGFEELTMEEKVLFEVPRDCSELKAENERLRVAIEKHKECHLGPRKMWDNSYVDRELWEVLK